MTIKKRGLVTSSTLIEVSPNTIATYTSKSPRLWGVSINFYSCGLLNLANFDKQEYKANAFFILCLYSVLCHRLWVLITVANIVKKSRPGKCQPAKSCNTRTYRTAFCNSLTVSGIAKGRLLACKRRPFIVQFMTFCTAKGRQPHNWRRRMAKQKAQCRRCGIAPLSWFQLFYYSASASVARKFTRSSAMKLLTYV